MMSLLFCIALSGGRTAAGQAREKQERGWQGSLFLTYVAHLLDEGETQVQPRWTISQDKALHFARASSLAALIDRAVAEPHRSLSLSTASTAQ